jgi:hypothetical protein
LSRAGESDEHSNSFWEHHWGAFEGRWNERDLERARAILSMVPEGMSSVLEVGCGDGLIINSVTAPDTMGVDISRAGLSSVRGPSLLCSLEELPFEDGRYDPRKSTSGRYPRSPASLEPTYCCPFRTGNT